MTMINIETNKIIFDDQNYDKKLNYLPMIVDGLSKLDPTKEICFLIDLDKTPVVFIMYISKVYKETGTDFKLFFREDSEELKVALEAQGLKWNSIKDW